MEVGRLATGRMGRRRLRAEIVEATMSRGAGGTVVADAPEVARTSWAVAAKARTWEGKKEARGRESQRPGSFAPPLHLLTPSTTKRASSSRTHLREGSSGSHVGDSRDEDSEVGSGDVGVSNELDQVSDNDTGHSGGVGGSLLEGSDKEGNHDGEDGSGDLGDEGGGGQGLDGGGDSRRGGHGLDEGVVVGLEIRVVEASGERSGSLLGDGSDLDGRKEREGEGEKESASQIWAEGEDVARGKEVERKKLTSALVSCMACSTRGMVAPSSRATCSMEFSLIRPSMALRAPI